jgi:thiamine-phosphate pyrophosphorylase
MDLRPPALCLITDRRRVATDARSPRDEILQLERWLDDAAAQVDLVQIREPDLEARLLLELATRVVARMRGTSTSVIVNDRSDVAMAAGADGVHLRASSPPVDRIRRLTGCRFGIGRSVHSVEEIRSAVPACAPDYFLFGTTFPTASKPDGTRTHGVTGLAAAAAMTDIPVLAVGGITPARAGRCIASGAAGIAAIGAFLAPGRAPGAMGLSAAARAFRAAMRAPA